MLRPERHEDLVLMRLIDYLLPATTPIEGEKLSDEWLKGNLGNLVLELAGLVILLFRTDSVD